MRARVDLADRAGVVAVIFGQRRGGRDGGGGGRVLVRTLAAAGHSGHRGQCAVRKRRGAARVVACRAKSARSPPRVAPPHRPVALRVKADACQLCILRIPHYPTHAPANHPFVIARSDCNATPTPRKSISKANPRLPHSGQPRGCQ